MAGDPDRTGGVLWPFLGVIGFYVGESDGISEIRRFASHRSQEVLLTRIFAFMMPGCSGLQAAGDDPPRPDFLLKPHRREARDFCEFVIEPAVRATIQRHEPDGRVLAEKSGKIVRHRIFDPAVRTARTLQFWLIASPM